MTSFTKETPLVSWTGVESLTGVEFSTGVESLTLSKEQEQQLQGRSDARMSLIRRVSSTITIVVVMMWCVWVQGCSKDRGAPELCRIRGPRHDLHGWRAMEHDHKHTYQTLRPLIGIVSQGGYPAPKMSSYIAASYVKFIESAGARAVPIMVDMPEEEIRRRFEAVNGILIPGGEQILSSGHSFYDTVKLLFDLVVEENRKGVFFPLHGTCLGFEALVVAVSGNASVLTSCDAENYAQPLYPTEHASHSRFFRSLPDTVVHALYERAVAMENHMHGVLFRSFAENPSLNKFFNVLTLSTDREKNVYVSTVESIQYPITATQWHPEKNAFEWTRREAIPHDLDAILVTQAVANSVVDAARRNGHAPRSIKEEQEILIYNWSNNIVYSGKKQDGNDTGESMFDEIYVFPPWDS